MSRQISTVPAGILCNNNQFFYAAVCQEVGLIQYVIQLPAPVLSTKVGNDAIGAAIVTALRNLDKGIMLRCGDNPSGLLLRSINGIKFRHGLSLQQLFNGRNDFRITSGTEDSVYLRHFLYNFFLIALGKASGNQNFTNFSL